MLKLFKQTSVFDKSDSKYEQKSTELINKIYEILQTQNIG